jgi:gamma-glutamyltranspeptidase/glutathione hydrolase
MAKGYIIAAGHPLTVEAGEHAFKCGGNAIDALAAAWFAACLSEAVLTSPGGGGFAMVQPASGRPRLYDFFAQTPLRLNPMAHLYPLEADFGSTRQVFHLGAGSIATPGCVAGILQMHADFGSLPLSECVAPAREMSRNGLVVTADSAMLLSVVNDLYQATPEAKQLFGSREQQGSCLREGERFINRDFEGFLEMLVSEGARWFYEGDISRIVGDYCAGHEGHLTREDFLQYTVEIREPLEVRCNGTTIWLNPPPAMGGTLVALGLLSAARKGCSGYPRMDTGDWQAWVEPLRLMSLLRSRDGWNALTGNDHERIREACEKSPAVKGAAASLFPGLLDQVHSTGTTQISIMDGAGNEVAMTTSNGAGSAIIPQGTGFMLNNMLGEDDLQPEGLGTWKPDTRLASMMAPTLAHLADGSRAALGSGGSNRIRSTVLQILRHLVDGGFALEQAVRSPRLHWEGGTLHAETAAFDSLQATSPPLPWELVRHEVPNLFFGGAHCVARTAQGRFEGIGDMRRGGVASSG